MTVKFTTQSGVPGDCVPRGAERALVHGYALENVYLPGWRPGVIIEAELLNDIKRRGTKHIQRLEARALITQGIWRIEVWQDEKYPNRIHWSVLCADEETGSLATSYYLTRERECPIR